MKFIAFIIGIMTLFSGLLPFLKDTEMLSGSLEFIPTSGPTYQAIIIVLGVIGIFYALKNKRINTIRTR